MAASARLCPPIATVHGSSRRLSTATSITMPLPVGQSFRNGRLARKNGHNSKWALKSSLVEQSPPKSVIDVEQLVGFLYEDLPHLFDDQGIDRRAYDENVKFRDPITKHDSIDGYLFNIALLKNLFSPDFQLHWVKQYQALTTLGDSSLGQHQKEHIFTMSETNGIEWIGTGPYEITTRWTMVMKFLLLPWRPELVFTGTSVMGINPENGKFWSHLDYWDSIKNNEYISLEGLWDVMKQLRIYKTPDLESPKYQILKRSASYEVRKYTPFIVVETTGDKLSGSRGFNEIAGYIFGKNSEKQKIPMTTPVYTQATNSDLSEVSIQIVLPSEKDFSSLPCPVQESTVLRQVGGGVAAVLKFSWKPTEDAVREKEQELRTALIGDGLKPVNGCLFARYNDPGRTWDFMMRNELLIWLEEFSLE